MILTTILGIEKNTVQPFSPCLKSREGLGPGTVSISLHRYTDIGQSMAMKI